MNRPHLCSRRHFLHANGFGLGTLALASLLERDGLLAAPVKPESFGQARYDLTPKKPHFEGTAKAMISLFMMGGPSQMDLFDPKPMLTKYHGQKFPGEIKYDNLAQASSKVFGSPWTFKKHGQCGMEISELLPNLAKVVDEITLIRSMTSGVSNHAQGLYAMNAGRIVSGRPALGSWLTYGLGSENQNLPGFVAMCPGGMPIKGAENWQSAFLPGAFQGTYVDSQHTAVEKLIENIRSPHADTRTQERQLALLRQLNEAHRRTHHDPRLDARIQSFELAFRMQTAAADAFDITREPQNIRDLYGSGVHGRQTLIARRLLERGVRMVQLWHGAGQPWDNHDNIETNHRKLANELDQPIAALLQDLKQRGMLEDTLVIWGGEFGRTPSVEMSGAKSKLGRDHNHYGFTVWMAGGGIKGGTVYGSTDEFGFAAEKNPVSLHDLHATILHLMGLDHERLTYRYAGRDFRLTDVSGEVVRELLA